MRLTKGGALVRLAMVHGLTLAEALDDLREAGPRGASAGPPLTHYPGSVRLASNYIVTPDQGRARAAACGGVRRGATGNI